MAIISSLNIILNTAITWHYAVLATIVFTIFAFLIDLITSGIVMILPKKMFNHTNKMFRVFKWEKKFYEKIGIKKWKDYLPIGAGPIGIGFKKDKVYEPNNPDYILTFLQESCIAEFMHFISLLAGFIILIFAPPHTLFSIALPVAIVNFVLQLLPFITQRYNRPKLAVMYRRAKKYAHISRQEATEKQQERPNIDFKKYS